MPCVEVGGILGYLPPSWGVDRSRGPCGGLRGNLRKCLTSAVGSLEWSLSGASHDGAAGLRSLKTEHVV
jgi:hypothetical protein